MFKLIADNLECKEGNNYIVGDYMAEGSSEILASLGAMEWHEIDKHCPVVRHKEMASQECIAAP